MAVDIEIQLLALKRSGNHAVAAWLCQQCPEPVLFSHHVPHYRDPLEHGRTGELPNTINIATLAKKEPERAAKLLDRDHHVWLATYEDLPLRRLNRDRLFDPDSSRLTAGRNRFRIFLLRDFYNWAASRLKLAENRADLAEALGKFPGMMAKWLHYAREAASPEPLFADDQPYERLVVTYNRWFAEADYRAEVAGRLGLAVRRDTLDYVPHFGGGSSFDGKTDDPSKMKVEERWPLLLEDRFAPALAAIHNAPPLLDTLNTKLFGMTRPFD